MVTARTAMAFTGRPVGYPDVGGTGQATAARSIDLLTSILRGWDGVEVSPHRFGGVEYRVGRREMGHVHAGGVADLPFPVRLRRDLVSAGRAEAHRTLPHTGWVSVRIRTEHDIPAVVALFRLNYERLRGVGVRPGMMPLLGKATMLGDRVADDLPA
ncbi:MAG TPA: luciferase family protein [Gemmatimonas sp.]|nr:luciferase family protein [Gemmatimonas sp.]